jgi:hypothetical protein
VSQRPDTIIELVANVALGAQEMGLDVSIKDVGWIISTFLEGLAVAPGNEAVNETLQAIADAAAQANDEE